MEDINELRKIIAEQQNYIEELEQKVLRLEKEVRDLKLAGKSQNNDFMDVASLFSFLKVIN